jgi:hypothetical protein
VLVSYLAGEPEAHDGHVVTTYKFAFFLLIQSRPQHKAFHVHLRLHDYNIDSKSKAWGRRGYLATGARVGRRKGGPQPLED